MGFREDAEGQADDLRRADEELRTVSRDPWMPSWLSDLVAVLGETCGKPLPIYREVHRDLPSFGSARRQKYEYMPYISGWPINVLDWYEEGSWNIGVVSEARLFRSNGWREGNSSSVGLGRLAGDSTHTKYRGVPRGGCFYVNDSSMLLEGNKSAVLGRATAIAIAASLLAGGRPPLSKYGGYTIRINQSYEYIPPDPR